MKNLIASILTLCLLGTQYASADSDTLGVLVMAHGGSDEWNEGILDTVAPLRDKYSVEVAFGMADAYSIQESVTKLEDRGAQRIAVVRLFISGESWYERTEQILGLREGAPARPSMHDSGEHAHGEAPMGHRMEFWKIDSNARFALSHEGLANATQMAEVLLSRANKLSEDPAREDILILAHGPEDDAEDQRWIQSIKQLTNLLDQQHNFRSIHVATLREDWEKKREGAEALVREIVSKATASDGTAIVIPFRVHGFGPYADVLTGLDYRADQQGLIPHPAVSAWIDEQVNILEPQL